MKRSESGQGFIEYPIVLAIVGILVISIINLLGPPITRTTFCYLAHTLDPRDIGPCEDLVTMRMNSSTEINVAANDINAISSSVEISREPLHGRAVNLGGGYVQYTPHINYLGPDNFGYNVCNTVSCYTDVSVYIEITRNGRPRGSVVNFASSKGTLDTKNTGDTGDPSKPMESLFEFLEQAEDQEESFNETTIHLNEAVVETFEMLTEYADELDNQELLGLFAYLLQEFENGNYEAFDTIPDIWSELGQMPPDVQAMVILASLPRVIDAYHEIDGSLVPFEIYERTLQLWVQAEELEPGITADMIPKLQGAWETIEQRNQFVEEAPPILAYVACSGVESLYSTGIQEYIELAQQFEAQLPPCEN